LPLNLYALHQFKSENLQVIRFTQDEVQLDYCLVNRVEFREKRCNITLKNATSAKRAVNVQVWVLNNALIEIWRRSEKWALSSLQPDQVHVISCEFKPLVPDVVWNEKARTDTPARVVIQTV